MLLVALAVSALMSNDLHGQQMNPETTTQKFGTLLHYINHIYVDTVDLDDLVEVAIVNMLEEMDPHSMYIAAEDLKAADGSLSGTTGRQT